jgi:outer membrane receptor protein involved in Fe transport
MIRSRDLTLNEKTGCYNATVANTRPTQLTGVVDQHNVSCWGRTEGRWRPGENVPTIHRIKLYEHGRTSLLKATPFGAGSVMTGRALVTAVTLIFIFFVGAAGAQDAAPIVTDSPAEPVAVPVTVEEASASVIADAPTTVAAPKATAPVVEEEVPTGPPPGVEVMQVKGRAVSGIETDVPESITQFDSDTIAALGAGSIADLAKVTPNVEIRSAGATTAVFFIRGVGLSDFSSNAAGAVAVYQDNVPLNTPALQVGQLYDVLTVDVKSGPQGSGLYRNASAGAIMTYTRKPEAEYTAKLTSSTGTVWSPDAIDAFMRDTSGYVNIPLIDGTLASRMAFRITRNDPFMRNGCGNAPAFEDRAFRQIGQSSKQVSVCGEGSISPLETSRVPPGLKSKVGDKNVWDARGGLRFTPPGTDMDWWLSIHGGRLDQDSTLGQTMGTGNINGTFGDVTRTGYIEPDQFEEFQEIKFNFANVDSEEEFLAIEDAPLKLDATTRARAELGKRLAETRPLDRRPYRGDYNKVGRTTRDTFGGFLRGEMPVSDRIDLTTITAYESYERFRDSDPDFTPDVLFETLTEDDSQQFTQDVKFDGKAAEGAIRWSTGAAFIQEELNNLSLLDVDAVFGNSIRREFKQETTAVMIYTEAAFDFLEDFTLEIGVRYNYETKSFRIGEFTAFSLSDGLRFNEASKTWREPTGKVSLTYHINDTTQMYIKYSRGYKVGHFNSNNRSEASSPARAEFIDAFEWGYKGGWWDGRVQSRGAFFYYRYSDYQVFVFQDNPGNNPPTLVIRNAEAVEQYGLEVSLNIEPLKDFVPDEIDDLKMIFRFGWIESQFLKFTNVVFRNNALGQSFPLAIDYAGNQLINSPQFKVSATFEWPFDLGEFGTLKPRYDVEWSDDIFFDPNEGRGSLDIDGEPIQPKYALGQKAWWIHNIRLSYVTPVGNVEVSGWVRNILDQRVKTYAFDASFFGQAVINFVGQPRTAGADVTITW